MVANVSDKHHLETYINHKFYHIPAKELSNVRLGVEYIAFYQSKNYFGEDSGVFHYAKIKEIKRYKRKECTELPVKRGSGEDEYLRFELEEILSVGAISTVEYGVELITYTTMYLLKNGETMHELSFRSRNEIEVYKVLKELSRNKGLKILRRKDHFMLGNIKIEILNSKKVRVNDVIVDTESLYNKIL